MPASSSDSKLGALITLAVLLVVIGVVVFYAWQWTTNVNERAAEQSVERSTENQSPDLMNISDQFDQL